jgi:hypothetical protein
MSLAPFVALPFSNIMSQGEVGRPVHAAGLRRYLQDPLNGPHMDNFRLVPDRLRD